MKPSRLMTAAVLMLVLVRAHAQDDLLPDPVPEVNPTTTSDAELTLPDVAVDTPASGKFKFDQDRDNYRNIELRSIIEEALRRNPYEQVRGNENARIELLKDDVFDGFWLPNLSLDVSASNHRYDRVYTSSSDSSSTAVQSPDGSVGIAIKDYTLFNWGRDYLQYQNDMHNLTRARQRLVEARRKLRFTTIDQYFNLVRVKEFLKIKREQLSQASFIHRLSRERLQMKTISALQFYQTRGEFLRAQTEYQQALFDVGQEEQRMANLLGDDYRPSYRPQEQLKYTGVNTTITEALKQAYLTSPLYRDTKVQYDTASRTYEKTIKDNLPLPKFTLGMGTYQQNFGPDGNSWLRETPTGRNVEMVAAVNMSWTLIGEGGLFNSRVNKRAYLDKRISEIHFYNAKRAIDVEVRTLLSTIRFLEQKVTIAEYQQKNARTSFDSAVSNFSAGRTGFPQVKLALDNWIMSDMNTHNVKYEHLQKKLQLAEVMGLDDLPGENFETLAVR